MPQAFDEDPVEAFKRNVWVSPFHEDDIARAHRGHRRRPRRCSGRTTPTPRAWPSRAATSTTCRPGLSDDDIAAIMGGNLASIMKLPVKV